MLKYKYSREYKHSTPDQSPKPALRSSMVNLNANFRGSTNSLASDGSNNTLMRKKKGRAPPPPTPGALPRTPELASKVRKSFEAFL